MFVRGVLSGGGFVWGVLLGGVLSGEVLSWEFCPGWGRGLCPGGGLSRGFCPAGFCPWDFVRGVLSGGFCPGGFCPGEFVRGVFSGGILSRVVLSWEVLSKGVLSPWGFGKAVLSGGFCLGGFCPRISPKTTYLTIRCVTVQLPSTASIIRCNHLINFVTFVSQ